MKTKLTQTGIRAFLAPIRWIIVTGLAFFLTAWEISILRAWIYIAVYATGGLTAGFVLLNKTPKLLNDRGKMQEGTKRLDKFLILTYFLFAILITPLVAGLDYRFNIIPLLPLYWLWVSIALYIVSVLFSTWPMLHNPFFEGTVRIQTEKSHTVITTGPYKIVRHPGYLAMLLGSVSLPLALGSLLAFIPLLIMIALVFIRTYYEDSTLQKELPGYSNYCKQVKYRLIPFIW